jgi:hypothetical protein
MGRDAAARSRSREPRGRRHARLVARYWRPIKRFQCAAMRFPCAAARLPMTNRFGCRWSFSELMTGRYLLKNRIRKASRSNRGLRGAPWLIQLKAESLGPTLPANLGARDGRFPCVGLSKRRQICSDNPANAGGFPRRQGRCAERRAEGGSVSSQKLAGRTTHGDRVWLNTRGFGRLLPCDPYPAIACACSH